MKARLPPHDPDEGDWRALKNIVNWFLLMLLKIFILLMDSKKVQYVFEMFY